MHQVHFSSSSNNPAMKSEFECWLSPPNSFKITFDQACSEYTEADFCGLQTFMEHPTITISQRCIKCTSAPAAAVTTSLPWKANLRNLGEEEVKSYTEGFKCWLIKCLPNCIFDDTVTITISHDAFNSPIAWCLPWKVNLSVWAKEEVKKFCFTKFCYIGWAMHSIAMHACFAATARFLPWKVNLSAWGRRRGQEHSSFYFSPFHLSVPVCGF